MVHRRRSNHCHQLGEGLNGCGLAGANGARAPMATNIFPYIFQPTIPRVRVDYRHDLLFKATYFHISFSQNNRRVSVCSVVGCR